MTYEIKIWHPENSFTSQTIRQKSQKVSDLAMSTDPGLLHHRPLSWHLSAPLTFRLRSDTGATHQMWPRDSGRSKPDPLLCKYTSGKTLFNSYFAEFKTGKNFRVQGGEKLTSIEHLHVSLKWSPGLFQKLT